MTDFDPVADGAEAASGRWRADTVAHAYRRMATSVTEVTDAALTEARNQAAFPGSLAITSYPDVLARLRGAGIVAATAGRIRREYAQQARAEGSTWEELGSALDLDQGDHPKVGFALAEAAFEAVTERPDSQATPTFRFQCVVCGQQISDYGPYDSHPLDCEHGHADNCWRMMAAVAIWTAATTEALAAWRADNPEDTAAPAVATSTKGAHRAP